MRHSDRAIYESFGLLLVIFLLLFLFIGIADAQEVKKSEYASRVQIHMQAIRAAAILMQDTQDDQTLLNAAAIIVANSEGVADGESNDVCWWPSLRTIIRNGYRGQSKAFKLYGGDSEQNVMFSSILIHVTVITEKYCDGK